MKIARLVVLTAVAALLAAATGRATVTLTVTTTADTQDAAPGDGTCADAGGACSLRAAIEEANALGGPVTVDVPVGTYRTTVANPSAPFGTIPAGGVNPTTGDLDVTGTVSIVGAGASATVLDAGNLDREFYVHGGATLTVSGATITHGFSNYDCDGGFAVHNAGTLQLARVTVTSNIANCGTGGAIWNSGTFGASDTTFAGNTMNNTSGGALYNTGTATIATSTFAGNSSHSGGAIWSSGALALTNVTLDSNDAWFGGGVLVTGGNAVLKSDTFSQNGAQGTNGGGVEVDAGTAAVEDTILAANGNANCSGVVTSAGHDLETGTSCGLTGPGDLTSTDPLLLPRADNGGPVETDALASGSPAIGAGDGSCPATDARGVARGTCDIGAYQYTAPASLAPTRVDDPAGGGTCPLDCSLRQAVATVAAGGTVTLPAGAYVLARGALTLARDVTLAGAGASTTSISHSSLTGAGRVLYVPSGSVSIGGVTIEHGDTVSGDGEPNGGVGGGMWIDSPASVALSQVVVSANSADVSGGGIDNDGALTIDRSLVTGNSASGSGLEIGGGIDHWGSSLTITNTTIDGNDAGVEGGGLESGGASTLKNDTFTNNRAGSRGAGMYGAGSITAVNTLLDGNGSANCGGSVTSLGHNLSTDATCPFTAVGDLQSAAASTAVDAGDDAQCTAVDRNGTPRPQGTHCDIGALETAGSGGGASAGSTTTTTTSVTTTPPTSSAPPAPPIPQPTPPPDAPHVAFTYAPQKPVVGRAIALTAETLPASAVPPTRFEWTFGDGSRATGARVTHVYGASGAFRVTLTVSDASGGTGSASARVRVTDGAPTVTLGRTPAPPAAGRPVTFKAFAVRRVGSWSATRITSWRWTFGDGTSAVGQQVTHTFASAGTYSVGVEIGDAGGSSALASSAVAVLPRNSVVAVDEGVAVAAAHTVTPPPAVVIGETISTRDGTSPAHH